MLANRSGVLNFLANNFRVAIARQGVQTKLELLEALQDDLRVLEFKDEKKLDGLRRKSEMMIRNIFGEHSKYLKNLLAVSFYPIMWASGMTDEDARPSWESGHAELSNLYATMIDEVKIFGNQEPKLEKETSPNETSGKIFVVHGNDEEMKQATARMLEKLGLEAIILHEHPNEGKTVIEKLMSFAEKASFAIVLLSPDDFAFPKDLDMKFAKSRARQNVILELGFFMGKLGRARVVALYRKDERFEIPSDYDGVLYVPYEKEGNWNLLVAKELKAAGFNVDLNKLA